MQGLSLSERHRFDDMLRSHPQDEIMSQIPQFATAEVACFAPIQTKPPQALHALVFNMERGVHLPEIADFLHTCPAAQPVDLIFANELDDGCARSGNRNTARALAQDCGLNYAYGLEFIELVDDQNEKGFHGNAIFSRWPLRRAGVLRLPEAYNWYFDRQRRIGGRCAVFAELDLNGHPVCIVSIHLENRTDSAGRAMQMDCILRMVQTEFPNMPVILGGDFNSNGFDGRDKTAIAALAADADARRVCLEQVATHEALLPRCAADGYTLLPQECAVTRRKPLPNGDFLDLRLDWLMLRGLQASDCRVISTKRADMDFAAPNSALGRFTGEELSDHNAIWAAIPLSF